MKHLFILLSLALAGCVSAPQVHRIYIYDVPAHQIIVCDNWTRAQMFPADKPLRGKCFNGSVKQVFSEPSISDPTWCNPYVYDHEVKHFVKGYYHK